MTMTALLRTLRRDFKPRQLIAADATRQRDDHSGELELVDHRQGLDNRNFVD